MAHGQTHTHFGTPYPTRPPGIQAFRLRFCQGADATEDVSFALLSVWVVHLH